MGGEVRSGALAALFATTFVAYRAVDVEDGNLRHSILVGRLNAPGRVPSDLPVGPGAGYDGQFYYRLAVDPFHLTGLTDGIRIDTPIRLQRIGYPVLGWVFSGGQRGAVPFALVLVNVLCFAALAVVGAALARSFGRSPYWGLLFCLYPGFLVTLSRDLTELLAAVLVVGALLALRRRAPVPAAVLLAAAVLTRETALILVLAVLLDRLRHRRRDAVGAPDLAWAVPAAAYVLWQVVVRLRVGALPAVAEHDNLAAPFVTPVTSVGRALRGDSLHDLAYGLTAIVLLVLAGLVVAGVLRGRAKSPAPRVVLYAFTLSALLTVSLSKRVWNGDPAELRTFMDVHLFGVAALLASARSRALVGYAGLILIPFVFATVYYAGAL